MGISIASEPLYFLMIVLCELCHTYSFLFPFAGCSFGNGPIDHYTDNRYYKYSQICDLVGQKFKFLCNLIGCEAQEGAD